MHCPYRQARVAHAIISQAEGPRLPTRGKRVRQYAERFLRAQEAVSRIRFCISESLLGVITGQVDVSQAVAVRAPTSLSRCGHSRW